MRQLLTRRFPLFMLPIATTALVFGAVREAMKWSSSVHLFAAVLYVLHLAWIALEARITVNSSQQDERATDRGTLQFYGTARVVTIISCVFGPTQWQKFNPWMLVTALLFVSGIALRLTAIRTLGRFYSHRVRALSDHRIVQSGPYRWIRHPAYTGMALANICFVIVFINPVSAAALVVLLLPSIVVRVLVEERVLFTLDGYSKYAVGRRRLIPLVW